MADMIKTKTGYKKRIFVGRALNGSPIQKQFSGKTQKEVNQKIADFMAEHEKEVEKKASGSMTLEEAFLEQIELSTHIHKPRTVLKKEEDIAYIRKHAPSILAMDITTFGATKPNPFAAMTASMLESGASNYGVNNCLRAIKAVLNAYEVPVPKITYLEHETHIDVPEKSEVLAIINKLKELDHPLYIPVLLAAYGPLRRGEICALTMNDFDFKAGTVTVSKNQTTGIHGGYVIGTPKTRSSYRTITLPQIILKEVKKRGLYGYNVNSLTMAWNVFLRKNGFTYHRFHSLRHFFVSYALNDLHLPELEIQRRGGWSNDKVMKSVYNEVLQSQKKTADRILFDAIENDLR